MVVPRSLPAGGRAWEENPEKGTASGPRPGMPLDASDCMSGRR